VKRMPSHNRLATTCCTGSNLCGAEHPHCRSSQSPERPTAEKGPANRTRNSNRATAEA
jgi:hypothetical protein